MLDEQTLPLLREGRNLLAFSGGADSTALFFLLLREEIPFDIAHVNYHTRPQSSEESAYAQTLARQYGKVCHLHNADAIGQNFEAEARRIRYTFFESLITAHGYDTLLTAHQLDDRLEWMLMQFCKGVGLPELLGMEPLSRRENYALVRPLLHATKSDLRAWLEEEKHTYYEDESNEDERYLRNRFRRHYATPLLEAYRSGIEKSFAFLQMDAEELRKAEPVIVAADMMLLKPQDSRQTLARAVDRWLKNNGYLLRRGERERLLKEDELIIGRRFAISTTPECTLLTPLHDAVMPKVFKEQCRTLGIGPNVRPYLYANPATFEAVCAQLQTWRHEA